MYDICLPGAPPAVRLRDSAAPVAAAAWNSTGTLLVSLDGAGGVRAWHRVMGADD